MQQLFIDFLKTRRSVTAKKMKRGKISEDHLKKILEAGIRVPDHGALKPWKLSVITGATQKQLDEEVIFTEFMKKNPIYLIKVEKLMESIFSQVITVFNGQSVNF